MSTHLFENSLSPSHVRRGKFACPLHAVQKKEKRCLEASRKEYDDLAHFAVGSHQVQRYVSANGRLYFGYECFLSPNNLANPVVFSAFLVASRELSQYFDAQNTPPGRFEVVITLQCVSLARPQFSYYFVDHDLRRVSDESILIEDRADNQGLGWNVAVYWDHISIFSAHHLCTTKDYDQLQTLLSRLQSQECEFRPCNRDQHLKCCDSTVALIDIRSDNTPSGFETLRNLLSYIDRDHIGTHATASIAKIMRSILAAPSDPKPRNRPSLGSTMLRSLRGILLSGDPGKNEDGSDVDEGSEHDAHPAMHEDPFESTILLNEPSSQNSEGGPRLRIRWGENE